MARAKGLLGFCTGLSQWDDLESLEHYLYESWLIWIRVSIGEGHRMKLAATFEYLWPVSRPNRPDLLSTACWKVQISTDNQASSLSYAWTTKIGRHWSIESQVTCEGYEVPCVAQYREHWQRYMAILKFPSFSISSTTDLIAETASLMFLRPSRKHYYSLNNQSDQFALRLNFLCRALRHKIDRTRCHRLRHQQRSSTAYFYGSASLTPLYNFLSLFQLMFILEKDLVLLFALCRRKAFMNQG